MPRIVWQDDVGEELTFDGHSISMAAIRNMYQTLLEETTILLHDVVLLGLTLPDLRHSKIHDALAEIKPGYSFLTDMRNKFHRHAQFLLKAMMDPSTSRNKFIYQAHSNTSGIAWNMAGIHEWYKSVDQCLGNLFVLLHWGSGQPARGTELCILAWINTTLHPRNVFWSNDLFNIVTVYNKTQTNTDRQRLICRSLEPKAGGLFIKWGALVVPTLAAIASCTEAPSNDSAQRFHTFVFTSLHGNWVTEDLTNHLIAVSGEPVSDGGIGVPMGIGPTRHLIIAIMRRHLKDLIEECGFVEQIFGILNEQSGHGEDVAAQYAISMDSIQNYPEEKFRKYQQISRYHHNLICPRTSPIPSIPHRHSPSYSTITPTGHELRLQEPEVLSALVSQLTTKLTPSLIVGLSNGINRQIADAFAAVTPINSAVRHRPISTQLDAVPEPIDVNTVAIHPARWVELRLIVGNHAVFKSREQAAALELSSRRKKDLLVILGTGGGKSLLFMAAAVNAEEVERRMVTVVVVPLVALRNDIRNRLEKLHIPSDTWEPHGNSTYAFYSSIILVTADHAASSELLNDLRALQAEKRLARVIIDEAHFILTSSHFRPVLPLLNQLRQLCVQLVLLTATSPPTGTGRLLASVNFLLPATTIVRAPTVRKNIVYAVLPLHQGGKSFMIVEKNGQPRSLKAFIQGLTAFFTPDDRVLIFCLSRNDAQGLAGHIECDYYHSGLSESKRSAVLIAWKHAEKSIILATTSSLGAGLDIPSVALVVHWKAPRNLLDYDQETGRAGRNGQNARSIVFWDPGASPEPLQPGQDPIGREEQITWLKTEDCRRIIHGSFMDGKGNSCFDIGTAQLCDRCEERVNNCGHAPRHPAPRSDARLLAIQEALSQKIADVMHKFLYG
jgi:hypothetical protein